MFVGRAFGFFGIIMIAEGCSAFEEYGAFLAHGNIIPIFVAYMHDGVQWPSNRTLVRHPFFAGDKGNPLAFRPRIIFTDDGAPPMYHRFLYGNGARRGCVHRRIKARHIIGVADLFGQLQHARKMRWHPLAGADLIFLNRRERRFGIEFLHNDHGTAQPVDRRTPTQRCRMI